MARRGRFSEVVFRRHSVIFLCSLALILSGAVTNGAQSADSPARKILSGWIPYYSSDTSLPSAVTNGDLIKEVMPFWYTLKSETKITDLYTPANPSVPMSTPLTTLRDSGFLIIPTITDGTAKSVLANLLASSATRTQLVTTITSLVVKNNFDGIDLDFEGFAFVDGSASWNTTRPNWVSFIKELSVSLHALGKILSVTTPVQFDPASGKKGYYVFDWASIASSIDRLRIMTYDYSTTNPGPIGPLTWIEQSLQYAVAVVPASKIYIGVAGYGRDWVTNVSGICPSQYTNTIVAGAKAATFVMNKAAGLAASYGAIPNYNQVFGEQTFTYQKIYSGETSSGLATTCTATRTAWYQDARSYGARASLVAKYQLGGIAAWTFGMEDPSAMEAVRQVAVSIAPDLVLATMSTDSLTSTYGSPIAISGTFQRSDGTPISGLAVHFEIKSASDSGWREIGQLTSSDKGSVSSSLILSKTSSLRFTTEGSWERTASQSTELPIQIGRLIWVDAPTMGTVGELGAITGSVQPHQSDLPLYLEKYAAGKWISFGATTSDSLGKFTFSVTDKEPGISRFRVSVVGDDQFDVSSSPIFAILVL